MATAPSRARTARPRPVAEAVRLSEVAERLVSDDGLLTEDQLARAERQIELGHQARLQSHLLDMRIKRDEATVARELDEDAHTSKIHREREQAALQDEIWHLEQDRVERWEGHSYTVSKRVIKLGYGGVGLAASLLALFTVPELTPLRELLKTIFG
jgi:hypothetical protein